MLLAGNEQGKKLRTDLKATHIGFEPITAWLGPRYATIAPVSHFLIDEDLILKFYLTAQLNMRPKVKHLERRCMHFAGGVRCSGEKMIPRVLVKK